jgi:hypothetical protein
MWQTLQIGFEVLILPALIAALIFRFTTDLSDPGRLKSKAEMFALRRVLAEALKSVERSDPRHASITAVWARLEASYAEWKRRGIYLSFSDALTSAELVVLAPFIEDYISACRVSATETAAGDEAALNSFKERMKANRLWPSDALPCAG